MKPSRELTTSVVKTPRLGGAGSMKASIYLLKDEGVQAAEMEK